MDKRILFHTGFPKTGTTSIQRFMMAQPAALSQAGVLFPYSAAHNGQDYFGNRRPQGPNEDVTGHIIARNAAQLSTGIDWPQTFDGFLQDRQHHTLIVSAETISLAGVRLKPAVMADLAARAQIDFVFYLRNAPAWLESSYKQAVYGHSNFCGMPRELRTIRGYLAGGYEAYITAFDGYGRVDVRNFDLLSKNNELLDDFCAVLGVPELTEIARQTPRANIKSVNRPEILLLRALKANGAQRDLLMQVRKALRVSRPTAAGKSRAVLPGPLMQQITARWDQDQPFLQDRFGLRFTAPDPAPAPPANMRLGQAGAANLQRRLADLDPAFGPMITAALTLAQTGKHPRPGRLRALWMRLGRTRRP